MIRFFIFLTIKQIPIQPFQSTDLLQTATLIQGQFSSSQQLLVIKNELQELEFQNRTQNSISGIAYLDFVLEPSTNYVVQIKLEQQQGQAKAFWFGLIPDSQKDSIQQPIGTILYSEQNQDGNLRSNVKGGPIWINDNSLDVRNLEMRINIKGKILKVGSLPNYDSVVQIDDPNQIENATPYRFFVWGLSNMTRMVISKLETVNKFDDHM